MRLSLLVLCNALIALMPQTGNAQGHVAHVYLDSIYQAHPTYGTQLAKADSLGNLLKTEVALQQQQLDDKYKLLLNKYMLADGEQISIDDPRVSSADSMMFLLILDEQKTIQNKIVSYNNLIRFIYAKDIDPIKAAISSEIDAYAKKKKFDIVFIAERIRGTYMYLNTSQDITPYIIDQLKSPE